MRERAIRRKLVAFAMTVTFSATAEAGKAIAPSDLPSRASAPPAIEGGGKQKPVRAVRRTASILSRSLWYRRSVRAQLIITFVAFGCVAALIAGTVTILQARKSTRLEIAASMRMAEVLVGETAELLQREPPAEHFLAGLPAQLRFVRHVRIAIRDASGAPLPPSPSGASPATRGDGRAPAPGWFAALIAPPVTTREVPVVIKGQRIGSVSLTSEAGDEIAEVWENTFDLAVASLLVGLALIGTLHLLLGRVLDPLTGLAAGLDHLERRNYRVRLIRPRAVELAALTDRFNRLAQALDDLRAENARLQRRLVTAQDDERRRTALELHDEVGPCLFGLKANAGSLVKAAGAIRHPLADALSERAREILDIVGHLQGINRSLLNRLRPMALGQIPLADLVAGMIRDRARQHPETAFTFAPETLRPSYGDSVDLTVYRCVQEALTNAIRHARAGRVDIELIGKQGEDADGARLELVIRDDGCGMDAGTLPGRGLTGLQERLAALSGSCTIDSAAGRGTALRISIPVPVVAGDGGGADR